jgi:hypothetical protein
LGRDLACPWARALKKAQPKEEDPSSIQCLGEGGFFQQLFLFHFLCYFLKELGVQKLSEDTQWGN